ncbi:glycoside hydrolase family 35 protein [Mycena olivaceomarginata]|nr:glycoside hydrolase family 35 protein [Mycena olivaceomarginata]
MRLLVLLASLLNVFLLSVRGQTNLTQWPVHNTGFTDAIQWDHYSIIIGGVRTFLWSGEIHYWRIPVPEVWRDLLEKIKAAGFNGISVYAHWAFHAPNNKTLDFTSGARNFEPILDIAKEVGLFVTMRGGPYVNAETTAGGFALWTTTGAYGPLRNNDPRYTAAWTPFMDEINRITAKYQLTNGGPIVLTQIENEICCQRNSDGSLDTPVVDYMIDLQENARDHDVVIPIITNAPNFNTRSWSTDYLPGPGEQDIYGLDSYPLCWSCNLAECGSGSASTAYADHFDLVSPTQPSFLPEFQGGSYNPWGGPQGGCPDNIGTNFVSMYYRHLAAERVTAANLYMLFGGQNWGGLATNLVSTSYDYSAPIQESRIIADKFYETKLIGLFFRAAQDLVMTDRTPFSTAVATTPNVGATVLRNPETQAGFYVARQSDMKATTTVDFKLNIATKTTGNLTVPVFGNAIRLVGVQSKIIVSDFRFGNNTLVYSTAEVLSHSVVDGKSILALWLPDGEFGDSPFSAVRKGGSLIISVSSFSLAPWHIHSGHRLSRTTPSLPPETVVFVNGPYLVRSLALNGSLVAVTGDIANAATLEVFAPATYTSLQWNGKTLATHKTSYGSLKASLPKPGLDAATLQKSLTLSGWKFSVALPEADAEYDDSKWVVADHFTTPNPTQPLTLPVLYADDYGFHTGVQIFRGRFAGEATGANLTVQGGTASGWSAWLNSDYIGSFPGIVSAASGALALSFANATLVSSGENVLTVVMDHSGHDQRDAALNPRGILGATLLSTSNTTFTKWTIAGNAGGESNIDPIRGVIAEGGLHAERLGWHLPGFNDSLWAARSPSDGVDNGTIAFFRTTSRLDVPIGYDRFTRAALRIRYVFLVLDLDLLLTFLQYGKFVPQIGHQIAFPVPPGILNVRGENTIGLSLWSQTAEGAQVDVQWNVLGVYESAWDPGFDASALQPGWTAERLQFA